MTRWARSKGSAASNERVEEEATPWSQLVSGVKQERHHDVEDLEEFEDDGAEEVVSEKAKLKHEPPADIQEPESDEDEQEEAEEEDEDDKPKVLIEQDDQETAGKKRKKKKRSQDKCLNCKQKGHLKKECPDLSEERRKELQDLYTMKIERKGHGTGRKKNKNKNKTKSEDNGDTSKGPSDEVPEGVKMVKSEDDDGSDPKPPPAKKSKVANRPPPASSDKSNRQFDKRKFDGGGNNKKQANKKPLVDITGQTVQDDEGLFQGFRVKKEAVKKLKSMQAQLKAEEKSEDEIAETMKRERRKAERELAKFRKMVCFNCRQSGHLLIDCPENKEGATTKQQENHCFKCGSKEHTSKDCKSKRKGADAYAYATCFICKETGHLAKSCPDNPRGLYPKGGGCRFCGSVEHLKADCNRKAAKDEKLEVKLFGRLGPGLEDVLDDVKQKPKVKPQKKVVKF